MNPPPPKKLLDQYRDQLRLKQYSQRTEKPYVHWVKAYIFYRNKRHPNEMGAHDLHSRSQSRRPRRAKSTGLISSL